MLKKKKKKSRRALFAQYGRQNHTLVLDRVICNNLILGHGFMEIRIKGANDWSMIK